MPKDVNLKSDFFAEIGEQGVDQRATGLVEPQPPVLPNKYLPSRRHCPEAGFKPTSKLDNAEKLALELKRQRKRYAPYLRDLAPEIPRHRLELPLEQADWRMESGMDRQHFSDVLQGNGEWQRVSIPHYEGPVGKHTAYYRFSFELDQAMFEPGRLFVSFRGADYKAHVFLNESYLGSHEGFFAPFAFDFTDCARVGTNTLVVKLENDNVCKGFAEGGGNNSGDVLDGDKIYAATGLGWDDPALGWHHCPPGMGLSQRVSIEARPTVSIDDVFVRPVPEESRAEIWLEVWNAENINTPVDLRFSIYGQNFRKTVVKDAAFQFASHEAHAAGPGINYYRQSVPMENFRAWELDNPWLYQAQITLLDVDGKPLDMRCRQFGMRSFRMDETNKPFGRFYLNGRSIRLRGANTMGHEQQCVFNGDAEQLLDDLLLAKIANMNFLRFTQRPVESEVYDICDRIGLMAQTDLPLFAVLRRNQFVETVRQAGEMEKLIRSHPSSVLVSYFNEPFPPDWSIAKKTQRHLVRKEVESFFECANRVVWLQNPDRVVKPIDGDYDPPGPLLPDNHCYNGWYNEHGIELGKFHRGYWQRVKPDWLYGCGEFGSEGLEDEEIMRRYYPRDWLPQTAAEEKCWSPSSIVRAQTGRFHCLWMDAQHTVQDWVAASQAHQAWATTLQTAAFRRDARMVTFAIHLFIDAFPAGWMKTIMDCERRPKPAFFVYRDLLTPMMVNLRTDRYAYFEGETAQLETWICNDTHDTPRDAELRYQLEFDGKIVLAQRAPARVVADVPTFQGRIGFRLPKISKIAKRQTAVVRLGLFVDGKIVHYCEQALTIFSKHFDTSPTVCLLEPSKKGALLAEDLALKVRRGRDFSGADIILIDSLDAFETRKAELLAAAENGAQLIFLELKATKKVQIGNVDLTLEPCGMNARHFVSRKTGHPTVEGFEPNDFRFWHDSSLDRCAPLLETLIRTQAEVCPILKSGQTGWGEAGESALAACEWNHGRGNIIICQIKLAGRTDTNPVAHIFARRLIDGLRDS